jgi:hypothetical protein
VAGSNKPPKKSPSGFYNIPHVKFISTAFLIGAVVFATLGLTSGIKAFSQEMPKFEGSSLSDPPAQSQPWTTPPSKLSKSQPWTAPPCNLSPKAIGAIEDLFAVGLADPRGCEYREIEVVTGNCWGGAAVTKTHGWVLPGRGKQQFGVCWSGLVYPLVSVGAVADLRKDILAMLADFQTKIDEMRAKGELHGKGRPALLIDNSRSEYASVAYNALEPIKAALLLRLGETDLAGEVWHCFDGSFRPSQKDRFLTLAGDLAWSLFDRAVCAHMRGDDRLALASVRALIPMQKAIEAKAAERKILPYLAFLGPLPGLLADEERRSREPAYTPILQMTKPPKGQERIAGLIRDLELVSARQWGQPGGVNLADDPIVQALIDAGGDAVEPLLDCLGKDTRLTRSVQFNRDFARGRTILGVHEAAYVALAGILKTDFYSSGIVGDSLTRYGENGRRSIEEQIRDYWQKNKGLTLQDRWYKVLDDDSAGPLQWEEAAIRIIQDAGVEDELNGNANYQLGYVMMVMPSWLNGVTAAMSGESLRAKTHPSVSDLLVKRIREACKPNTQSDNGDLRLAATLALALARWDGQNHRDVLADVSNACRRELMKPYYPSISWYDFLPLLEARIKLGDPQASADYTEWISTSPQHEGGTEGKIYEPMWLYPKDAVIDQATRKLFVENKDRWSSFGWEDSPLLGVATFRSALLRGLDDTSDAFSVAVDSHGVITFKHKDYVWHQEFGGNLADRDELNASAGEAVTVRVCDLYANRIATFVEGAPAFDLRWPEAKRSEAVNACAAFLKRYGPLFQFQPQDQDLSERAHIHFPRLDHPATAEDVEQGRAIFSLSGQRRLWKMPKFPMRALWTTLKDNPSSQEYFDENGQKKRTVMYDTLGTVFQAEETLVNGKWERFYGFFNRRHMAMVPAAEIEFDEYRGGQLFQGFLWSLQGPAKETWGFGAGYPKRTPLKSTDPLPVTLSIGNRSGMDLPVPAGIYLVQGEKSAATTAITLKVTYSNKIQPDPILEAECQPVAVKKDIAIGVPLAHGPILGAAENVIVAKIDLRDYFDVGSPGTYQVEAIYKTLNGEAVKTSPAVFVIAGE